MDVKVFVRQIVMKYRTVIGAMLATLVISILVYRHHLASSRAVVPLIFAWMFALHSLDYRQACEKHEAAIVDCLSHLEHAGVDAKLHRTNESAQEIASALHDAGDIVSSIAADVQASRAQRTAPGAMTGAV